MTYRRQYNSTGSRSDTRPILGSRIRATAADVKAFWGTEACGSHFVEAQPGTAEFYTSFRQLRYQWEWHIPRLVPFAAQKGKKVLEIGCGNGADGVMFAQAGADYTGVDLTEAAVEATRNHFQVLGLNGTFQIENAENLSFADESFDFIYSYGVLHHTLNPENAFAEMHRVLKPRGTAVLMLYHKHSFNYYVRIMGYMRLRLALHILSHMGQFARDRIELKDQLKGVRGNRGASVWQTHYDNFLRQGWSYLKAENFVHHATDGPECPCAFVYTRAGLRQILSQFAEIEIKVAHFPLRKYVSCVPAGMEKQLASWLGWYLIVDLTK